VPGSNCLDLYAGTGALGFEAASRGAARVIMVEQDRLLAEALQRQAHVLQADMVEIVRADALKWLAHTARTFDIVFLDPPFGAGLIPRSLEMLIGRSILRSRGMVYAESEPELEMVMVGFEIVKQARTGRVQYMLLEPIK